MAKRRNKKETDMSQDQNPIPDAEVVTETSPPSDVNGHVEPEPHVNGNGRPRPVASWRFPVDKSTNVQVALWPNLITLQGGEQIEVLSMTIARSYKKDGEWINSRSSFSFRIHELPVLQHAIDKAYQYALDARQMETPF
jgi:hypothetical protein